MKKILVVIALIAFFYMPALCQEMPNDVPKDHYAHDAVYDLVERGINVSQGYPDGTFRGNRYTNRYETAYLMSALALSLRNSASPEMDVSDLKDEIAWLRHEIKTLKEQPENQEELSLYGDLELKSRFGGLFAYEQNRRVDFGPEFNYRLKYTVEKNLGRDASLKMNIDTMDGGFNTASQYAFPSKLMDIEGDLTADIGLENPAWIKAIVGPGSVLHRDTSGVAPSEDYTYFSRPRPSFILGTVIGEYDVSGAYVARGIADDGSLGTSEVNLQLGRKLGCLPIIGTTEASLITRYAFVDFMDPASGPNCILNEISFYMLQGSDISEKLSLGMSSLDDPYSRFFMNFEFYLKNLNGNGTDLNFKFNSVGVDYRPPFVELEFIPTNIFSRKIQDGSVDIALEVIHPLSRSLVLKSRSDWVGDSWWSMGRNFPGSSFTQELSFDYFINKDFILNAFYKYYYVPSRIAQFSVAVPEVSDLLGIGLNYKF